MNQAERDQSLPRFHAVEAMLALPPSLLLLTLGRLLFVPVIIVSLEAAPLITALALILFIVMDLYDGVVARQLGADDSPRRILDSLVDRASIWPVYFAVTTIGLLPPLLLGVMLVRDLYCGYLCQKIVQNRNVVIRADWMYRGLNLMLAGWVVMAPFAQMEARTGAFVTILAFSAVVAVDLKRSVAAILEMPSSVRSAVIPAGEIRRLRHVPKGERLPLADPRLRSV